MNCQETLFCATGNPATARAVGTILTVIGRLRAKKQIRVTGGGGVAPCIAIGLLFLAGCTQLDAARQATVEPALSLYRVSVCDAGAVGGLVRDDQWAAVSAGAGVYVEADSAWQPGDTIDDWLVRRAAVSDGPAVPPNICVSAYRSSLTR